MSVWSPQVLGLVPQQGAVRLISGGMTPLENAPGGSDGKESACSARDLGLIPGLGRSPEEGKGYPLQYSGLENIFSRASLIAQLVKNPPAMQKTPVRFLGWEDPLEKG